MNRLNPEQMTGGFFFFPQETLKLAHSTAVRPPAGARLESESLGSEPAGPLIPGAILHIQTSSFSQL